MYYHVMCHRVSDHAQLVPNCHMSPSFRSCSELDASFEISQHGRHTINRAHPRHQLWKHSYLILVRKSMCFNVALILIKDAPTFEHNLVAKSPPNRTQHQHRISQHWRHPCYRCFIPSPGCCRYRCTKTWSELGSHRGTQI
jgi:hypothetical protein